MAYRLFEEVGRGPQLAEAIHLLEIRVISTLAYNAVGTRNLAI